jgi:hypothetical protein
MSLTRHLTLEDVASEFENWRRIKKPSDHIPSVLWQQAKKLSSRYRISQITRMLRISATQYHRYIYPGLQPIIPQIAPIASTAFVKIKNPLATQSAILYLKLIRKDGVTLNCYYPDTKTLHQTMQWFLES